jgi:hypothetical protein
MKQPKVFISYSWTPIQNKNWVLNFAERLSSDFVHVIIDEWDAKEGQDKYQFMEQMVNNPEIDKVLVICNKDYSNKANKKRGGVGIESQIISSDIYEKVNQEKFIPIIREYENDMPCLPTFIKNRFFIDLSNDDNFEDNYEQLIRNLFNKPRSQRPAQGSPPPYINEDEPILLRTANKIKTIKNALDNNKPNYQAFINDYYSSFLLALKDLEFELNGLEGKEIDDIIVVQIEKSKHLRNNFIEFINLLLLYPGYFDLEKFHKFLEDILQYHLSKDSFNYSSNSFGYLKEDHFNFINYELFLYYATLCIKREEFENLGYILNTPFLIQKSEHNEIEPKPFSLFSIGSLGLINLRNKRLNLNRINIQADTVKERAKGEIVTFDELKQTDIILHYISLLNSSDYKSYGIGRLWFPHLAVYRIYRVPQIEKMISLRYFNKIKVLFNIKDLDELFAKIAEINEDEFRMDRFYYEYPSLKNVFNKDKIGKIK